ncbi:MAG: hypothetical protein ACT4PG_06735, partial [Panacagrimonas sp.]
VQAQTERSGQFWLVQDADQHWTMGERLLGEDATNALEYRFGRDAHGYWTQHSTTGFERRLRRERALYPLLPLMPATSAEHARLAFAPSLTYEGIAENPGSTAGLLVEIIDGRKQEIRIDTQTGALLQRGETRYSEFMPQNGALLPRVIETRDPITRAPGLKRSIDAMISRYTVESVRYDEVVPAGLLGPQKNCFTVP